MGAELTRMGEAGERAPKGGDPATRRANIAAGHVGLPTLGQLGINVDQSYDWRKLARLDDETFDATIRRAYDLGKRPGVERVGRGGDLRPDTTGRSSCKSVQMVGCSLMGPRCSSPV
jgi:hypothetical protein